MEEKARLLHCVVVGGGPTGVEFSGELSDFIRHDVHHKFAHVKDLIHVTLIEVRSHTLFLNHFDITFVTFLHSSWSLFDMLLKLRAAGYLMICLCKMLHPIQGGSQPMVRTE